MNYLFKLCSFFSLLIIVACSGSNNQLPDVSDIKVDSVKIKRLDVDLFKKIGVEEKLQFLDSKYNKFSRFYFQRVLNLSNGSEKHLKTNLTMFFKDTIVQRLSNSVLNLFPSLDEYEQELTKASKYLKYYYPQIKFPQLLSCISCFNQKFTVTDQFVAFSLDQYLGGNSNFYSKLNDPAYLKKSKNPENLIPDILKAVVLTNIDLSTSGNTVLSAAMSKAKLNFLVSKCLPHTPEFLIMGLSPMDIHEFKMHEAEIWDIVIENKLLFKTDILTIKQLTEPAPFSNGISQKIAGRAMNWIAWQILKAYEKENNLSVAQIMDEKDASKILRESVYKP